MEREKVARGVDGRSLPWGDHFEPTRANVLKSRPTAPGPLPVGEAASDESIYRVRGLVGNIKEWCLNRFDEGARTCSQEALSLQEARPGGMIEARGGGWHSSDYVARPAARFGPPPEARFNMLGFRLAAPWPPPG